MHLQTYDGSTEGFLDHYPWWSKEAGNEGVTLDIASIDVMLSVPLAPGKTIPIKVSYRWPKMNPELGNDKVMPLEWRLLHKTSKLIYQVVLLPDFKIGSDLAWTCEGLADPDQDSGRNDRTGCWVISGEERDLDPDQVHSLVLNVRSGS